MQIRTVHGDSEVIDYYEGTNDGADSLTKVHPSSTSDRSALGQTFKTPVSPYYSITIASFYVYVSGSNPRTVACRIYEHTGTYGSTGLPTGEPLTSVVIDVDELPTGGYAFFNFTFSPYVLSVNTAYCIVLEAASGTYDVNNRVFFGRDGSSSTHSGNGLRYYSGSWATVSYDALFYLYGIVDDGEAPLYSNIDSNSTMLGSSAHFSVLWTDNDDLDEYQFGWNFSSSWENDSSLSFPSSSSPQWSNITKSLGSDLGMFGYTIQWQIWAWDSAGNSNTTGVQSFQLTAKQMTFYHTEGGSLEVDESPIENGTAQNFAYGSFDIEALPSANYVFVNFTWDTGDTLDNPYTFTVEDDDAETLWAYFIFEPYPQYHSVGYSTNKYSQNSNFTIVWTDVLELDGYIFGHNSTESGEFTNGTWTAFASNPETIINAVTLNDTKLNVIAFQWWANNTEGNWNTTGLLTMTVHGYNATFTIGSNGQLDINGTFYAETTEFTDQDYETLLEFQAYPNGGYAFAGYEINGEINLPNPNSISLDADYTVECFWNETDELTATEAAAIGIIFAIIALAVCIAIILAKRKNE